MNDDMQQPYQHTFVRAAEMTGTIEVDPAFAAQWIELFETDNDRYTLTYTQEFKWSRRERWVNAFLRFMLWPIGPERLPKEYAVTLPDMRVDNLEQTDERWSLTFTSSPDASAGGMRRDPRRH